MYRPEVGDTKPSKGIVTAGNFAKFILLFVLIAIFVLPFLGPSVRNVLKTQENQVLSTRRPVSDLHRYSASLSDYLRPSEYHPLFGLDDTSVGGRQWAEKTLYLGYVPILLTILGVLACAKAAEKRFHAIFFACTFILAIYISGPPKWSFAERMCRWKS